MLGIEVSLVEPQNNFTTSFHLKEGTVLKIG